MVHCAPRFQTLSATLVRSLLPGWQLPYLGRLPKSNIMYSWHGFEPIVRPVTAGQLAGLLADHPLPDSARLISTVSRSVTAGEVRASAAAVAEQLRSRGVESGQAVVIQLPNGPEFISTMFGVWLAGAVFVPANARQPMAEFDHVIGATGPAAVIDGSGMRVSEGVRTLVRAGYRLCHLDLRHHRTAPANPANPLGLSGTVGQGSRTVAGKVGRSGAAPVSQSGARLAGPECRDLQRPLRLARRCGTGGHGSILHH